MEEEEEVRGRKRRSRRRRTKQIKAHIYTHTYMLTSIKKEEVPLANPVSAWFLLI